jgi:hypothetical protein
MEGVRTAVIRAVRYMWAADARGGILDFRFRVDAEDENGKVVYSQPFEHALSIIPATAVPAGS